VSDELLVTTDGAIRIVTINRPDDLNVVNAAPHHRLLDVWRELERDRGARCVVLTGAGKTFSGGGDFVFRKEQHRFTYRYEISAQASDILHAMINFRLPVVAAVNGPAIGLGASPALCCDLVLMSERSYRSDPHVSIGLTAGDGGALQTTKRAFSKHLAHAAIAIVDYGLAAETLELGADDHIDKVREFLGADKYDAIPTPEA
jgi:enoyl-CoA hydratase